MKKIKRLVLIVLTVILSCSALVACDKNQSEEKIVSDGKTEYKVVVSGNATKTEKYAVTEFSYFFKQATGLDIEVVGDEGITHNANNRYISIGDNALYKSANLGLSYIKKDRVIIKTKDKTVYLIGGGKDGTLYAVYHLLRDMFNYDFFFTDAYYIDRGVTDLSLKNYDYSSSPDFSYRLPDMGYLWDNYNTAKRLFFDDSAFSGLMVVGNDRCGVTYALAHHNSFIFLPKSVHFEKHKKWYSSDEYDKAKQLCYTAHGDQAEYSAMLGEVFEVAKENFIKDRENTVLAVSIQDDNSWCNCPVCSKNTQEYGAESSSVIIFLNDLNKMIKEWFAGEGKEYARDYKLTFLAYYKTVGAPAVYDDDKGKYIPKLKADPEIAVTYAPITGDFSRRLDDPDSQNSAIYNNLLKWSAVCDNLMMWAYATNYSDFLVPVETFNSMQDNFKLYKDLGAFWVFNECQHTQANGGSGWLILRTYLESKMMWDINADENYYTDKFFKYYFQDAGDIMRKYYDEFRTHWDVLRANGFNHAMMAYWGGLVADKNLWPLHVLTKWSTYCDTALEKVKYMENINPSEYKLLKQRITTERISPNYLILSLHQGSLSNAETERYKKEFKDDVTLAGLSRWSEGDLIDKAMENLGIV